MTTHTHEDQDGWDDNDQERDQHARRHGRQHSYKRTRPAFRHDRPRLRPADGECGLRLIGVDGHCAGPRISLGNGRARNRRGCTEHAAQTLVRRPGWYITGGTPRARVELEAHMRAVGSWLPEMGRPEMGRPEMGRPEMGGRD